MGLSFPAATDTPVREFVVSPCQLSAIRPFVGKWHYGGDPNGVMADYCFKMERPGELVGAMIFGRLAMAGAWEKYADSQDKVVELRRLCCVDDTPKNAESFFIGKALRWLKKYTDIETVVSYADETQGHKGTIYQAANFKHVGFVPPQRIITDGVNQWHDKVIRTKNRGEIKPFAKEIIRKLESGEAEYITTKRKNIYLYPLQDRKPE